MFTVCFEDISMARDIKKAISMVRGVTKVSAPRHKRLTSYEKSMKDIEEGRVDTYASIDDFFNSLDLK